MDQLQAMFMAGNMDEVGKFFEYAIHVFDHILIQGMTQIFRMGKGLAVKRVNASEPRQGNVKIMLDYGEGKDMVLPGKIAAMRTIALEGDDG